MPKDSLYPINKSRYKVKQDSHAIHYMPEGNVTTGCMLFRTLDHQNSFLLFKVLSCT